MLGTQWEPHGGSNWEQQTSNTPPSPKRQNKPWGLTSLVARNVFAYLCPLPFLALANGRGMNYACTYSSDILEGAHFHVGLFVRGVRTQFLPSPKIEIGNIHGS
jgi:hypothetical protein